MIVTKRHIAIVLGLVAFAAGPASARAGTIYGICDRSVCTVDDRTGKKRVLLRGGSSGTYTAVGVSRSGTRTAFVRSEAVFRAGARGRSPERVGTALRQAAPDVDVRPDGGAISWIDVIQRPDIITGSVVLERNLITIDAGAPASESRIVAVDMHSGGWLGSTPFKQAFGDGGAPWFVCAIDPQTGCGPTVAADPARALDRASGSPDGRQVVAVATPPEAGTGAPTAAAGAIALFDARTGAHVRDLFRGPAVQPAFSPDGRKVAFVRGRDLYVVPTTGGRAKRLAKRVTGPAWARR